MRLQLVHSSRYSLALLDKYALLEVLRIDYVLPRGVDLQTALRVEQPHVTVAQILLVVVDAQVDVRGLRLVAEEVGKATR